MSGYSEPIDIVWEKGQIISATSNDPLVQHFLDIEKACRANNSWQAVALDLRAILRFITKKPEDIARPDALSYLQHLREAGYAPATINRHMSTFSSFAEEIRISVRNGQYVNPIVPPLRNRRERGRRSLFVRQPRLLPRIVDLPNTHKLLKSFRTVRDSAIVLVLWFCCLRLAELCELKVKDLNYSKRRLRVRQSKNGYERTVFLTETVVGTIDAYLATERPPTVSREDQLFVSLHPATLGNPLSPNAVQKMLRYHSAKSCDYHVHPHMFRHTGITQLVENGMPLPIVRHLVGHRSPKSTEPYLHLADPVVQREFEVVADALESYYADPGGA